MISINVKDVLQLTKLDNYSNISNYHLIAYQYPQVKYDSSTFSPAELIEFIGKPKNDFYKEIESGRFRKNDGFYKTTLNLEYTWDVLIYLKNNNLDCKVYKDRLLNAIYWQWIRTYNNFQINLINKYLKLDNFLLQPNLIHPSFIFNNYYSFAQFECKDHFSFHLLTEDILKILVGSGYCLNKKQIHYGAFTHFSLMELIAIGCSQPINPNFISTLGYEFKY